MAVPKKKTSPSRRGMRRAHMALKANLCDVKIDPVTGDHVRNHHLGKNGMYNGIRIIPEKVKTEKVKEN
ncbi:50S ribosomal protein L32 [Candidatus Deianiraea vastatrix]|uniref:Large ribosomal subunit protein bL32 n=1 Tax=Candidatus Deianiraea vastatrix TaxID=2163644 RepID=A0A5B8XFX6_9RICK|nr:50S ribosomal protein L32 [Candidatus Deianiraea vastatrix]QED23161.1 50S ribosomal protein L32 [Candidatus Deianiraea vastatrix]